MRDIMRIHEVKDGKAWRETFRQTDPAKVNEDLMRDLIAKKLHKAAYIKTITDRPNYDGTRTIIVTYDNQCRSIYTVKF